MSLKPDSWAACEKLLDNRAQLDRLIIVRLVELAFINDSAVSIRAIELLRAGGGEDDDGLGAVSTEGLERVKARILELATDPDAPTSPENSV
jgi:hypothetical protein